MMVRGVPATATWYGKEMPARAACCEKTLPCAASKQSGYGEAVGARWSKAYDKGATGCELGSQQGDGGELSLLWVEAQAKEDARRGNESTGVSRRVLGR